MRYTYGATIETFNGARRVEKLLGCLDASCDMSKFSRKIVVEDKCPENGNHDKLAAIVAKHPGWELVSLPEWGNMQGCADYALLKCETDFVWCISDDVVPLGDPFKNFLLWAENANEKAVDNVGAVAPSIYHAVTHLVNAGWLPGGCHADVQEQFYSMNWMAGREAVQFDCHTPLIPSVCAHINGAVYCLRRDAWDKVGGFDLNWDVCDQEISYSIQLETDYIIVHIPTDPWIHAGGCAQNASFIELQAKSSWHHNDQRCIENFGSSLIETHHKVHAIAREKSEKWQTVITPDFFEMCERTGGFKWKFV